MEVSFDEIKEKNTDDACESLSLTQRIAWEKIMDKQNIFVTGPAGSGKSFLIEFIKKNWENIGRGGLLGVTSTTGVSALNVGGSTLHSYTGIRLGKGTVDELKKTIAYNKTGALERIRKVQTLIIDEVSMLSAELFEKLDILFRHFRSADDVFFGGVQLVCFGDLCQLPPVNAEFVFTSRMWKTFMRCIIEMSEVFRQTDEKFVNCLNKLRFGIVNDAEVMKCIKGVIAPGEVADYLVEDEKKEITLKPTVLISTNRSVDNVNIDEYEKLDTKEHMFEATYSTPFKKYRSKIDADSRLLTSLGLRIGAQVMITRNHTIGQQSLVNGHRGVVIDFNKRGFPIVRLLGGTEIAIPPLRCDYELLGPKNVMKNFWKKQVPLKLAWAITIHKSQGLTMDSVVSDFKGIFNAGQGYVALSRVRGIDCIKIVNFNLKAFYASKLVVDYYKSLIEKDQIIMSDEMKSILTDKDLHIKQRCR